MPELPEVETTRRGLAEVLVGRRIEQAVARRTDLRFPLPEDFGRRLTGRTVSAIGRRAKYLLFELDDEQVLIAHMGMSGSFTLIAPGGDTPPATPHDHVILQAGNGGEVRFHDPRRFGYMDLTTRAALAEHKLLRDLGPEPLGAGFTVPVLEAALAGRRGPIKAALLDQRIVAGLGNIYACEALYYAGISPRRRAGSVRGVRAQRLVPAIRQVLTDAIAAGGSSLRDYKHTDGRLGYFQTRFAVYDREGAPCPLCRPVAGAGDRAAIVNGAACSVRRILQTGRSTFYCPRRQH